MKAEASSDKDLLAELQQLKSSQLKKRATAAGATAQEIEEAEDAEDTRAALVTLILTNEEAESA
eukprot:COSAG02_NODE_54475_length_296_cov_0.482234_1_plen_63_part_10